MIAQSQIIYWSCGNVPTISIARALSNSIIALIESISISQRVEVDDRGGCKKNRRANSRYYLRSEDAQGGVISSGRQTDEDEEL